MVQWSEEKIVIIFKQITFIYIERVIKNSVTWLPPHWRRQGWLQEPVAGMKQLLPRWRREVAPSKQLGGSSPTTAPVLACQALQKLLLKPNTQALKPSS